MGIKEEQALRDALDKTTKMIEVLTTAPLALGRVLSVKASDGIVASALVQFQGQTVVLAPVPGRAIKASDAAPGAWVTIQGSALVEVRKDIPITGAVVTVSEIVNDDTLEAQPDGGTPVRISKHKSLPVKKGDRVLVNAEWAVANLGQATKSFVVEPTSVSWADIGGQDEAKLALQEAVELPFKHPELYKAYGKKQTKGVLLHGPSGTGKTLLAKAAATSLAATHGERHSTGFIYVKGPEVLSKWVGESESTIRSLFSRAREHKQKHGYPAVIFVDEADALLGKRGGPDGRTGALSHTIVPMFLAEMDGFEDSSAVVLLATNRPDVLDPAVVRDGRVDRKVYVGRPNEEMAASIFQIHLKNVKVANDKSVEELAVLGTKALFHRDNVLARVKRRDMVQPSEFTLGHIASGAMIAGMCQQAAGVALHRDIASGTKTATGISEADITLVAQQLFRANISLNHEDDLTMFCQPFKDSVVEVVRATA